jgi:hypothetical protein
MTRQFISPGQHAILDYGVAGAFLAYGMKTAQRHPRASALAFLNGAMVLGMSLLTDYPGGVFRKISFRGHRTGDIMQAALAGFGPVLLGFADDPESKFFYGQAASEVGVIATTDWDGTAEQGRGPMAQIADDETWRTQRAVQEGGI